MTQEKKFEVCARVQSGTAQGWEHRLAKYQVAANSHQEACKKVYDEHPFGLLILTSTRLK